MRREKKCKGGRVHFFDKYDNNLMMLDSMISVCTKKVR